MKVSSLCHLDGINMNILRKYEVNLFIIFISEIPLVWHLAKIMLTFQKGDKLSPLLACFTHKCAV